MDDVRRYASIWATLDLSMPMATVVPQFLLKAAIRGRPLRNVITQYDIDPSSLVEQSLEELRRFSAAAPRMIEAMNDLYTSEAERQRVTQAFKDVGQLFGELADDARSAEAIAMTWAQLMPTLRAFQSKE
jgi:hypothetical protein